MERRVLLATLLSVLVVIAYQALFVKPAPKKPAEATSAAPSPSVEAGQGSPGGSAVAPATALAPSLLAPATPASGTTALVGDATERDIKVETAQLIATFTNRGARLKSWRLKNYHDRTGQPLDLVATELTGNQPLPFSLKTPDEGVTGTLNGAVYAVHGEGTNDLSFEYRDDRGLHALKEFRVDPASYLVDFHATVTEGDRVIHPTIVWGPGLGDTDPQNGRGGIKPGSLYSVAGKVSRLAISTIATQPNYEQDFEYAGIEDHYFMSIAVKPGKSKLAYSHLTIPPLAGSKDTALDFIAYSVEPAGDQPIAFYIGPKAFDTLVLIDRNLTKAINFGMFSVIVVPLLRSLNWIHAYVGNYGWAIVLLTVFINLLLFPLSHKSVVSMRKMQEIQPETKAIQERYAKLKTTDPAKQKMNQELMALYKERGVNPASGCIPLLLTFPVFLAFYSMLQTSIELRGAPFGGWIHDLSLPDPYYVLPIVVGLSQLATQWMTPQTGVDPTQQRMMMIMPLVLMFLFVSTPAGALLYWFVGSIWRIGQQYLTNYLIGPPNIRTMRPAAERRVKRVGSGKTDGAARGE